MTMEGTHDMRAVAHPADDLAICPACGARNPVRARFCIDCGARIVVDSGERRTVTVLFADLSGFTSYSETADPEQVRALANEAAERLGEIVVRYGGTVDKIIGDCVMAIFGAPVSHEDDPERAVRAALEMQTHVTENADRYAGMPLRVGVHSGEAMYAPVGPQGDFTVLGDTVNTSARLQSAAARGAILIGEATARAVGHAIDLDEVEPITAKGKEKPVPAWRVVGVKGARTTRTGPQAPMVGRSLELNRLQEIWERARAERQRHHITLIGAPGLGKSRLIGEFEERVSDAAIYTGRCVSYGEGITYLPVTEIVKSAAGIMLGDDLETVSLKLGALLERLGTDDLDELRTMAVALANLVAAPRTPRGTYRATEISKGELHWGIRRILELLSRAQPILVVFEDLHWAEPTLLELIEFIADGSEPAAMLVVGSARPELKDAGPSLLESRPNRRLIELHPLDQAAAAELVAALIGSDAQDGAAARLLEAASGNPLFLEETIRMLVEEGVVDESGRVVGDLNLLQVPDNLAGLISARLDRLSQIEKRTAGHASVIGNVFWSGAVGYLDDGSGDEVDRGLQGLEARDVARAVPSSTIAGEREYAFKHGMLRDVAYGRIPKSQRITLHERCGEWIARTAGDDEFVEFIAYHLEQACRLAQDVQRSTTKPPPVLAAVQALRRAGVRAEGREGTREAARYYSRALDLVGDRFPETAAELRLRRCGTSAVMGDLRFAVEELMDLASITPALGRSDIACNCLLELANIEQAQGKVSDARKHLEEASRLAEDVRDAELMIKATYGLSSFKADFEGALEDAAKDLRRAIARADAIGDLPLRVGGRLRLGTMLINAGRLAEAEKALTACATLAGEMGSLRHQAAATTFLGVVKYYRGPRDEAERLCRQAIEWLERTADRYVHIQGVHRLAMLALAAGRAQDAEAQMREGLSLAERIGGWALVETYRYLTEALCMQGRVDEAAVAAASARDAAPAEDPLAQASSHTADALVATERGDAAAATSAFIAATDALDEMGMQLELADTQVAFARSLTRLGDGEQARMRLMQARAISEATEADGLRQEIDRLAETFEGG